MDWLSNNSGSIVTVFFSVLFVGIAFWVYKPSNKKKLQDQAMIPFDEGKKDE